MGGAFTFRWGKRGFFLALLFALCFSFAAAGSEPEVASCDLDYAQLLAADRASPGAVSVRGTFLTNPADLSYMRLSHGEIANIAQHMTEEMLNRSLSSEQATALKRSVLALMQEAHPVQAAAKLEPALQEIGLTDPAVRAQMARNIAAKVDALANHAHPIAAAPALASALRKAAQSELQKVLATHEVPHYSLTLADGRQVPVVLVNKETEPLLRSIQGQELSFGDGVKLYPKNGNTDHGVMRVGTRIEDYFFPGEVVGDTHQVGLGGKAIAPYLENSKGGNPIIETAYALSPEEKQVVDDYHLVRRAGIFRVRNKWAPGKTGYDGKTAVLERGHELCYTFGTGLCSIEHSRNMQDYLMRMGVKNPDQLLAKPEVQSYLTKAYAKLRSLPINSPKVANAPLEQEKILHDWMLFQDPELHALLAKLLPPELQSQEDQVRFFNYLIGIDSSRKYAALMKDLDFFTPDTALKPLNHRDVNDRTLWPVFAQPKKDRVAAIFVYDNGVKSADEFKAKIYQGAYYHMNPGEEPARGD